MASNPAPVLRPRARRAAGFSCILRPCAALSMLLCCVPSALAQRSTPVQLLHPSGGFDDGSGRSVAVHGDTLIVGASLDDVGPNANQGSAHVYRWTGSGWTWEATLTASDGRQGDSFGSSVALHGDTVIVGAIFGDAAPNTNQGSAYIFTRTGSTWTQQAKLVASDGATGDQFAFSVDVDGDTAIAGANYASVGLNFLQGAAYVFTRSGTIWTQSAKLTASDGAAFDEFGKGVALENDTALVGSWLCDVAANIDQGAAYSFTRSGATWTQQAKLTAPAGAADDCLGYSVALAGETALVGAIFADVGANANQGSAFVFTRSGAVWTQQAQLTASSGAPDDNFGFCVALHGDTAVVGAYVADVGANPNQGSAWVFKRSGAAWSPQAYLADPDGAADDLFGVSVAVHGDTVLVGAIYDDVGASADRGSAWVYSRVADRWIGPDLHFFGPGGAGEQFGKSVATWGDTALVGAWGDEVGGNFAQGSAYVFVRTAGGWTQQAHLTASDGAAFDFFGHSVSLFGETAIIGAIGDDVGVNTDQGSAYVFARSGATWTQQAKLTASDGLASDEFGTSVFFWGASAVVGAPGNDNGPNWNQGAAYVFNPSGATWIQGAKLTDPNGLPGQRFGSAVAVHPFTILVGAPTEGWPSSGSASLFTHNGSTWTHATNLFPLDSQADDKFGSSVALYIGDTALVGAPGHDLGANPDQGAAYVFTGSGSSWSQQAKLTAADGAANDQFGTCVATAGAIALVGAPWGDVGASPDRGAAYVFTRAGPTWLPQAQLSDSQGEPGDQFGSALAFYGQAALVGAPLDIVGGNNAHGSAHTFEVVYDDFSLAYSYGFGATYPTLATALAPALSGHEIIATPAAWEGLASLNTTGRSLTLDSTDALRAPRSSSITLSNSSALVAANNKDAEIFGDLATVSGASAQVVGESLLVGDDSTVHVASASTLIFNAPSTALHGTTTIDAGAAFNLFGPVSTFGPLTAATGFSIITFGSMQNLDTWDLTAGQISTGQITNRELVRTNGAVNFSSNYLNDFGATTAICSGTLTVSGTLTNNGAIVAGPCANDRGGPASLDCDDDLLIGPDATFSLPFADSVVSVAGYFQCAINDHARFAMNQASLRMDGPGPDQKLELMSVDIGADPAGNDPGSPGHFPIGSIHIAPGASAILIDAYDNDGLGQGALEAIYVAQLTLDAGAHLGNTQGTIYYSTLIDNGATVDALENLVPIPPGCNDIDFNNDEIYPDILDLEDFLNVFAGGSCSNDPLCDDVDFNNDEIYPDIADLELFLDVFAGGSC